jgi:hypothetical protein
MVRWSARRRADLVLTVDLPDTQRAMAASAALAKLTGVAFTTAPAVALVLLRSPEIVVRTRRVAR